MLEKYQILSTISYLPIITNDGVLDGSSISASSYCKKCVDKHCLTEISATENHNICRHGFSYSAINFSGQKICIGGYINSQKNNKIGGFRRKELNRLLATDDSVNNIIKNINKAEVALNKIQLAATSETISFLHDVRTSLSLVMSSCERLIAKARGASFAEKLRGADPDTFRLYQAIALLSDQLGLVDVLSNPESIAYGAKSRSDIYQFFYKMVKLFEPKAWGRNIEIRIEGEKIYENVDFYNSFQLVPIVLLDNAIKYGNPGTKIIINYSLKIEGLYIKFSSFGPIIPIEYRESIFSRGVRAPNAGTLSNTGCGLGLYIASQIINVHNFEISCEVKEVNANEGWNIFTLFIDENFLAHT